MTVRVCTCVIERERESRQQEGNERSLAEGNERSLAEGNERSLAELENSSEFFRVY